MDRPWDRLSHPDHYLADKETITLKGSGRSGLIPEAVVDGDQAILRFFYWPIISRLAFRREIQQTFLANNKQSVIIQDFPVIFGC